jgi:hypothetical protein
VDFEGFDVAITGGRIMPCTQNIPQLRVVLGNHTITDDFYVMELPNTNVILGVQWLVSIGKHSVDYQAMQLDFKAADGKKVVLRGMSNDAPRIVSTKQMEGIFRHGDVTYATKCLITTEKPSDNSHQYHTNIQTLSSKHDRVFVQIPPGRPPDRGFEHTIELEDGAKPVITTPYRHPKKFKDEIE